ncbi:hypothetical protein DQ04_02171110 [Trypanosoma grayi]|uniref:hypothetical protein n=1 Tax=Trypanosoma grayi TaxID=71804 RepID=UPI0004F3FD8A|nr:hypothetical protein DQ04_02171110 [Trypanosoma grayi]KEG11904.1 hypothetical protein DQ04_02171110 [Trypanosoma grayi]
MEYTLLFLRDLLGLIHCSILCSSPVTIQFLFLADTWAALHSPAVLHKAPHKHVAWRAASAADLRPAGLHRYHRHGLSPPLLCFSLAVNRSRWRMRPFLPLHGQDASAITCVLLIRLHVSVSWSGE